MRHKRVAISEKNEHKLAYYDFDYRETNDREIEKMKKILRNAITNELTERQRYCICEHYLNGRSMKNIANELCIHPSTVTRHIQSAKNRLKRIASCYN
ncbi:MAG: sigma-70 family RNA polymerase sigma factor [Ruminococcus sp.]|nr:sigma-70 family RNA polymerase sigma factor [Ruminococcus sp.]